MKIIGHRGAKGLAPENTLAGFRKALEHRVDEIEFDIRVTKDNIPVLLHDAAASDAAGNKLIVQSSSYQELKAHKPDLVTLEEVLAAVGGKVALYVEVKSDEPVGPIVRVLRDYLASGGKTSDLMLASFSQKTLRALHRELPEVQKIVIERWSGVKATWRAHQLQTRRLSMKALWLWTGFLRPMHRRGWQISPYTVNDPAKIRKWRPYLYAVVTDYPDRFER